MRHRIFEIIEASHGADLASSIYDAVMMAVILVSIVPLAFKTEYAAFAVLDLAAAGIFLVDYALRLLTADLKLGRGPVSFVLYPLTPMAIIDLLAILPSFGVLASGFRLLKLLRMLRMLRVFRVFRSFKLLRYSRSIEIIVNVIRRQKEPLIAVCTMAVAYVLVSALVVFNVEPESFDSFFEAVYWAAVSLTTVGYGDISGIHRRQGGDHGFLFCRHRYCGPALRHHHRRLPGRAAEKQKSPARRRGRREVIV